VILDETSADYRPIVQVIDNFWRNHKLGILFETKVGKGKLLVCTVDLLNNQDKPEVRQFLHSLIKYADSSKFSPGDDLGIDFLKNVLSVE